MAVVVAFIRRVRFSRADGLYYEIELTATGLEAPGAGVGQVRIEGVPKIGTITLFEEAVETGPTTTVQSNLGIEDDFVDDTLEHIIQAPAAAATLAIDQSLRYNSPNGTLIVESNPDIVGGDSRMKIVIRDGHGE